MHNLKQIRENLEYFKTSLSHRNSEVDYDQILDLDKKNRQLIQEKEKFEMEKKNISKSKDESLFEKSKEISKQIENLSKKQKIIKNELDNLLSSIPNLPLDEVPVGKDENDNIEVTKSGEIKDFKFKNFKSASVSLVKSSTTFSYFISYTFNSYLVREI